MSAAGGTGVPADWCLNLSVLESLPAGRLVPPAEPEAPTEDGVRYVAFVMSDGDNLQWLTGGFATEPKYYGSPVRGRFPMTWEVSPLLARFAPSVLRYLYRNAKPTDGFVTGPGLPGYTFPHLHEDRVGLARQSAPFLRESGLRTISVLNANAGSLAQVRPWMELPEVDGAIYKDYSPYHRRRGELEWHREKPIMAYRFLLWEDLMGVDDLVREIGRMPTEPRGSASSYALINVHAWSYNSIGGPMEAVQRVVNQLPPNTRVVTANQLLGLLRRNCAEFRGK